MGQQGGVHHDEEYYENPEAFDPERFMRHPNGVWTEVNSVGCSAATDYAFGIGGVSPFQASGCPRYSSTASGSIPWHPLSKRFDSKVFFSSCAAGGLTRVSRR